MKSIFIALLFIFSVEASEWKVRREKNLFFLEKSENESYQIMTVGGVPKFLREKELGDKFLISIYYAGSAGTSKIIEVERAIVFNKFTLKYLGDYPYKYIGATKQPIWKVKDNILEISDQITGLKKTIPTK